MPNKKVALKYLVNSQNNIINEFLNEAKSYTIENDDHSNIITMYGISQNIDTKNYIMILQDCYCENCDKFFEDYIIKLYGISQNPDTKNYISILQDCYCEYCGKDDSTPLYSAIWTDGLLEYNCDTMEQKRIPNKEVALKFLSNSQNNDITNEFLNEIKSYFAEYDKIIKIYGISQNPATKVYIIVLQNEWIPLNQFNNIKELYESNSATFVNGPLYYNYDKMEWERKPNEKVTLICLDNLQCTTDEFLNEIKTYIDEKRTKDCVIEISKRFSNNYGESHFNNNVVKQIKPYDIVIYEDDFTSNSPRIIGISQNPNTKNYVLVLENGSHCINDSALLYSAIWIDGPLGYIQNEWKRIPNKEVALKCLYNSQNITNKILNEETKFYSIKRSTLKIYGISQNPNTKDYILVIQDGMKHGFTSQNNMKPNKVTLKYLSNLQNNNITNEFLVNKVESYFIEYNNIKIYGISQNPNTKDYILVCENGKHCENCGKMYKDYKDLIYDNWCKACQINSLKENFANWTSENKIIDELIQEMQLKIKNYDDIIIEWIPFDQFNDIEKIGKNDFTMLYSTIWMNGPLKYNQGEWNRMPNKKVTLKYVSNARNNIITDEFLNEVRSYSINMQNEDSSNLSYSTKNISNGLLNEVKNYSICDNGILQIYGISQDPYTKDYIIVLQFATGNFVNHEYIKNSWYWFKKLYILDQIIDCLKIIHDKQMVHHDLHTGNILILPNNVICINDDYIPDVLDKICISDMGLCREVGDIKNTDETKIYGVMPYVAPEVLKGNPYTQAADIYSFGMIMYFIATRRQPFDNCAHDNILALKICNGIRPEINEQEIPESYIELIKKCWDPNPNNRPNATKIKEEINKQFEEARKNNIKFPYNIQLTTHPKACYTSRLLNPFTNDLPRYDNISNNSVEVVDFTE
ncbi:uncharacterized protein OCT59_005834 [Rhizophagus irregularis]|uniref:uncharacterized protein n=1 Tax=Rhizophagus irregularis TaxID=588596 RepID=UPI00332E562C|nr:hypothetical protein OCT59_005834 [Rhizophagus irregularis]